MRGRGRPHPRDRVLEGLGLLVDVSRLESSIDRPLIDLDTENGSSRHRRSERLGAAHPAETRRQHRPPGEVGGTEMPLACRAERLVRPLEDALSADVDPRAGGHLSEHRQPCGLEPPELVPRGPRRDEERVGDEHPRRVRMGPEDPHGLSRLDEKRLVVAKAQKRPHDLAECLVRPCCTARAAVHDERLGVLGDLRIEIVEEHPQRRLGLPRPGAQLGAARRSDRRQIADELLDGALAHRPPSPLPALVPPPVVGWSGARRESRCRNRNQLQPVATTK